MCTRARLVQAGQVSSWSGMNHDPSAPPQPIRLKAGQAAYLEVSIDPAAHGESGIGPITRVAYLKTASGQQLEFELRAEVTGH